VNILILNYEYPPLGGGAGVCAQEQANGLVRCGHHVTVVTTCYKGLIEEETKGQLKIIRLRAKRRFLHASSIHEKLSWLFLAKQFLVSYCQNNPFDACLAHFTIPGGSVARILKKKFNIPYIIVSHGHDIPWFFPKQMFFYHLLLYFNIKKIMDSADGIVVLNEHLKDNAIAFLTSKNKDKVTVIPNGCDTSLFEPDNEKKSEMFKIIFTGRLVAQKDPLTFLKALVVFNKIVKNYNVEIIGDGILKDKMLRFVKNNHLGDKIIFRGWLNQQEMLSAYQSAHVHVMTSRIEAMSMSALESLSTGTFLISTDAGSNAQLIELKANGLIVSKHNTNKLSEAIGWYYDEMFANKYNVPDEVLCKFRNNFDWKNIINRYNRLLENIRK